MRFKTGLVIGFGVGYYLGAKAGRERYIQLRRWVDQARDSEVIETATDKAKAVVDLGVERARDLVDRKNVFAGPEARATSTPLAPTPDIDLTTRTS